MKETELKALVTLLDDDDYEVTSHVEKKIMDQGTGIIPFLEEQWETNFNPTLQKRLEDLIHQLQFDLVLERLEEWKQGDQSDLLRVVWILSTYQYPDLEYDEISKQIEQVYVETWRELKDDLAPFDQVKIINSVLFDRFKFRANTKNFHSPANSMLNSVLESKRGNPISLSTIYLLIAEKLNLPIYGVNLPNLFILTYKTDKLQFYINVFNKGLIFSKEDIHNYIEHLQLPARDIFFEPCTNLDIAVRYLRNLVVSFEKLGEYQKSDEVKTLLKVLDQNDSSYLE